MVNQGQKLRGIRKFKGISAENVVQTERGSNLREGFKEKTEGEERTVDRIRVFKRNLVQARKNTLKGGSIGGFEKY